MMGRTIISKAFSGPLYVLLKSDVTRRDHVSIVMDAGSRSQFHS